LLLTAHLSWLFQFRKSAAECPGSGCFRMDPPIAMERSRAATGAALTVGTHFRCARRYADGPVEPGRDCRRKTPTCTSVSPCFRYMMPPTPPSRMNRVPKLVHTFLPSTICDVARL